MAKRRRGSRGGFGGKSVLKQALFGGVAAWLVKKTFGDRFGVIQDAGVGYLAGGKVGAVAGVLAPMAANMVGLGGSQSAGTQPLYG